MLHFNTIRKSQESPWVVFIHGAGGSSKTWNFQFNSFKKHFNILTIDLRDHGSSKELKPHYENYNFSIITEDIKEVLDHLKINKAHFITLSFGSVLLQHLAMSYPKVIDKSVVAGGIFKGNISIKMFVYLAKFMNTFLSYPIMYRLFSFILMPKKRNLKARRIYQIQAQKLSQSEYMKWVGLYKEFFNLLKNFYSDYLKNPTLVIMGSEDFVFLQSARSFVNTQDKASLAIIPEAGHICNIEEPDTFNRMALQFLLR